MLESRLFLVVSAALAVTLACSGSTGGGATASGGKGGVASAGAPASDDLTSVPGGLANTLLDGEVPGGLTLIAFTLTQGATGPELYAAVRNDGQTPSCEPGMTTYFVDDADQVVATVGSVLRSQQFYRLDSGEIVSCVDPGQIAMAGSTDLPAEIVIGRLAYLKHAFPAFTVGDLAPVDAPVVSDVKVVSTVSGSAYTGTVTNALDMAASEASVAIFPVNRVGRPLGMATISAGGGVPAAGSWMFQTSAVHDPGVDYVAYASFGY
jgi:hypothetical protein